MQGYANKEAKHVDEKRRADGMNTRRGTKKAEAVTIPEDIAQALKQQPNTPQGHRDALIMCLSLTADARKAAAAYFKDDAPAEGILWRRSNKGTGKRSGQLSGAGATRALTKRVELLGRRAGIEGLSAHHYWATYEARNNTPVNRLMDAGGWSSPAMPLRYNETAHIANEGTARLKET